MKDESGSVTRVVGGPGLLEGATLEVPGGHLGRDGDGDAVVASLGVQVHEHHHLARYLEWEYRVTIPLVQNLPLTLKQKFRFGQARTSQAEAELLF